MEIGGMTNFFFQNLASNFFPLMTWNPLLLIGDGKRMIYLFSGQILALDSNWKDPKYWFKVAIMNCQILTTQAA